MKIARSLLSSCALLVAFAGLALTAPPTTTTTFTGDAYQLDTCPVSGEKLGKDAVTVVLSDMKDKNLNGTQMKFCCEKCVASFKADPSKFMPKVEEQIIKASGTYPLGTCLVMTDEAVDGSSKTVVFHNRVYKFCCKKCIARFEKDPTKYQSAYEAQVVEKQKPTYKAAKCPVSGEPIKADSADVVIAGRLVRCCCPKCAEKAKADPKGTLANIDAQVAGAGNVEKRAN